MKAKRTNKRKCSIEDRLENLEYLVEKLKQKGEKYELVYVASGGQHVDTIQTQNVYTTKSREEKSETSSPYVSNKTDRIRQCIELLMAEKYGNSDEPLFNIQAHWQAIYRILVDKDYCRDSDFDGFDAFIHTVMPEKVNKPYAKASVKQISQTDFSKPFKEWVFDHQTSKTRKPFDRMVAVTQKFLDIIEENRL